MRLSRGQDTKNQNQTQKQNKNHDTLHTPTVDFTAWEREREASNSMAELPDELWRRILEMGVSTSNTNTNTNTNKLTFKDLCCISISCKRLHRFSNDDSLWSSLLSFDFPSQPNSNNNNPSSSRTSAKLLYRTRYEKDKARKIAAHRRAVLWIESRIAEHSTRLQELQGRRDEEIDKIKAAAAELSNLHKVRQASVALNVWQPEVIRGRQKQIVEQCAVPVASRVSALEMELKLCKQQIIVFEKAYRDEKQRLEAAKEQLVSMKYHPLQAFSVTEHRVGDHSSKRKKLKRFSTAAEEQSGT